ncbi:MAG: hypothetical protein JRG76_17395 [Deltaproteobacteria bacterium]|nr:hypothetical protein [Deltaproteobacteria bacterium]
MRRAVLLVSLVWAGCTSGTPAPQGPNEAAALVVAAGMVAVEPSPVDIVSAGADLDRLGLAEVDQVFEVTTPADEPFAFELISRGNANAGPVRVSVAHAADNGAVPLGGAETLADVGVDLSASSTVRRDAWVDATGDGFARVTISGSVAREQVIAVEARTDVGRTTALVAIRIGPTSSINLPETSHGDYPGVVDEQTIYSSDSWRFGLPTLAVSGDRTSVVVYEGDQGDPNAHQRYEMRLQHDGATGAVTGGASEEASPDTGHWRDHEAAALFNVLALVHSGVQEVTLKLSFDRGATFGQVERFGGGVGGRAQARLAQIAMAADYTLAVVYWTSGPTGASELVLVEGRPSAFDGFGSPTRFAFDPPQVLYRGALDVTPAITGIAYSQGGDIVVGYGFTSFEVTDDWVTTATSEFRCAVRLFGEAWADHLVERDVVVARDPSVSLVGEGPALRIFYAYEGVDGVRLRTSPDAGATWSAPQSIGERWSYLPTVLARDQEGALRVDLLYLTFNTYGTELHLRHWDDFDTGIYGDFRLTEAKHTPMPMTQQVAPDIAPPAEPFTITEISWFGYDATLDGDDVVVVYDEQTTDLFQIMIGIDVIGAPEAGEATFPGSADGFTPAEPPPLAPGLTEPVPPPVPDHMHQLRIARLD